jgi:hypothetical protein
MFGFKKVSLLNHPMKTNSFRKIPKILWILFVAMFSFRCAFEPHEEFISTIQPPEPITVSFIVNDPGFKDPYYLIEPTMFHFRLKELNNAIVSSEIRLNGGVINSNLFNGGVNFLLDPYAMQIREHTIDMVLYVDTKSGSLANMVGAEFYEVKQSFKVIIDPTPPEFHSFRAGFENGYLTLRWVGPQEKNNFVYKIRRYNPSSWFSSDSTLYNPQANYFIDPGYVGGDLNYNLSAKGFGFEKLIGMDDLRIYPVDFKLTKDAEADVKLVWTKSDVNPENVYISIASSPNYEEKSYPFSSSGEIHIGKLGFMEELYVNVFLHRRGYSSQKSGIPLVMQSVPDMKQFNNFAMLEQKNKLLIMNEDKIYRYSLNGFVCEDSLSAQDHGSTSILSLIVNPNESKAYVSDNSGNLISFDPLDFDNIKHHDLKSSTKNFADPDATLAIMDLGNVTDSGLLTTGIWQGSRYVMVLDINNGEVLWHSPPGHHHVPTVSNDGKYIAADIAEPYEDYEGWILKRENGDYLPLGKIDKGDHVFLPGGEEVLSFPRLIDLIYYPEDKFISVYKITDPPQHSNSHFNRIREASIPYIPGLFRIGYDPFTNFLWFTNYESIDLFNPTTMQFENHIMAQHSCFQTITS